MKTKIKQHKISVSFQVNEEYYDQKKINSSQDAYSFFLNVWNPDTLHLYEEVQAVYLARDNRVIGYRSLNTGTSSASLVNIKLLIYIALECNCNGFIVAHNHPSGNLKASEADRRLTEQIQNAAKFFDLNLLDHLVISGKGYYSFADEGCF